MSKPTRKLLIVEDDPGLQKQLQWSFDDRYQVVTAADRDSALVQLRRHEPAVVTLDLGLPPDPANASEGLATLDQILALSPNTKVIVVTGNDDADNAIKAIGLGAYDFYQKPIDATLLGHTVERAYRVHELEQLNRAGSNHNQPSPLDGLVAASPEMLQACRMVEKVAPADVTTLLLGDSGTGKELLAKAVHELSPRAGQPFVAINCAAIPEPLLESELFGHEKGAFTGAVKQTLGRVQYADKGTLFLDEVGDLPLALQAKLLRFLQERVIERVGGREEIGLDVRVVCATHRNLQQLIEDGQFREDLYYRISEITIRIPRLSERAGDAVLLARVFLDRFCRQFGRSLRGFSPEALRAIEAHGWPGNVRELENRIKRAVILAEGNRVAAADLELQVEAEPLPFNLRLVRDSAECRAVIKAVNHTNSNLSRAAEVLGITRPTLYTLLSKHGIKS